MILPQVIVYDPAYVNKFLIDHFLSVNALNVWKQLTPLTCELHPILRGQNGFLMRSDAIT